MKNLFSALCLFICLQATAQSKLCGFDIPVAHNVYVFSENRNHTIIELFGERVPTNILNIINVSGESARQQTDSLCMAGLLEGSIFIFPRKDASKTIRFCNDKEYREALIKERHLNSDRYRIEKE